MNHPVIEIDGLSVIRGRRTLVSLDRLRVEPGEVLGVLGPNGAGKSTLLRCCVGMTRPSSGTVRILGERVERMRPVALTRLRRRIAYLAQVLAPGGEMPLTVREVVAVGRTGRLGLFRPLQADDWRQVDAWLDRLGLTHLARQPYGLLSGGEQRKTLLAMAMVQQPELLLLDEPTANLDVYWREQIVRTLDELRRQFALTIVLVCHDLEALPSSTARVLLLDEGQAVAQGVPSEVLNPERIAALYGDGLRLLEQQGRFMLAPGHAGGST